MNAKTRHYIYTHDIAYKMLRPLYIIRAFFMVWIITWVGMTFIVLVPVIMFKPTDTLISQIAWITALISGIWVSILTPKAIENTSGEREEYLKKLKK